MASLMGGLLAGLLVPSMCNMMGGSKEKNSPADQFGNQPNFYYDVTQQPVDITPPPEGSSPEAWTAYYNAVGNQQVRQTDTLYNQYDPQTRYIQQQCDRYYKDYCDWCTQVPTEVSVRATKHKDMHTRSYTLKEWYHKNYVSWERKEPQPQSYGVTLAEIQRYHPNLPMKPTPQM